MTKRYLSVHADYDHEVVKLLDNLNLERKGNMHITLCANFRNFPIFLLYMLGRLQDISKYSVRITGY